MASEWKEEVKREGCLTVCRLLSPFQKSEALCCKCQQVPWMATCYGFDRD